MTHLPIDRAFKNKSSARQFHVHAPRIVWMLQNLSRKKRSPGQVDQKTEALEIISFVRPRTKGRAMAHSAAIPQKAWMPNQP